MDPPNSQYEHHGGHKHRSLSRAPGHVLSWMKYECRLIRALRDRRFRHRFLRDSVNVSSRETGNRISIRDGYGRGGHLRPTLPRGRCTRTLHGFGVILNVPSPCNYIVIILCATSISHHAIPVITRLTSTLDFFLIARARGQSKTITSVHKLWVSPLTYFFFNVVRPERHYTRRVQMDC